MFGELMLRLITNELKGSFVVWLQCNKFNLNLVKVTLN